MIENCNSNLTNFCGFPIDIIMIYDLHFYVQYPLNKRYHILLEYLMVDHQEP